MDGLRRFRTRINVSIVQGKASGAHHERTAKNLHEQEPKSLPVLHVYGPGGPLPAMKEAAAEFSGEQHILVVVTGGPEPKWLPEAQQNADLIYSGS